MDDLRPSPRPGWPSAAGRSAPSTQIIDDEVGRFRARPRAQRRSRRSWPRCASGPRRSAPAELERFRGRLAGLDDRQREAVEALDPRHRRQAAARADRAAEGGGRHGARRAAGRGASASCSTSSRWSPPPRCADRHPGQRAGPVAGRRTWPSRLVAAASRPRGRAGRGRDRRRPAPGRPDLGAGRPGRVRQGGAGRRARRAGRRGRALGQGPAVGHRPGPASGRACPTGPIPATPWSARRLDGLPPGARGGHRIGAAPGPAGRAAARPDLRRAAGQHRHPAGQGRRSSAPSWWPPPPCERLGLRRTASPRCSTVSVMLPQVGQGALAVECRADDEAAGDAARPPSTHPPSRARGRRRAGVPGRARRRLRPAGRGLRRPSGGGDHHHRGHAGQRWTAASSCVTAPPGRRAHPGELGAVAGGPPASTRPAGRPLLPTDAGGRRRRRRPG